MIVGYVSGADGDSAYAVKRLVRGMCSSRESARQGFASCLAQVLTVLPNDEVSFSRCSSHPGTHGGSRLLAKICCVLVMLMLHGATVCGLFAVV